MVRTAATARWWRGLILGACLSLAASHAAANSLPPGEPPEVLLIEDPPVLVSIPGELISALPPTLPPAVAAEPPVLPTVLDLKTTAVNRRSFYRSYRALASSSSLAPLAPGPSKELPEPATPLLFAVGLSLLASRRR